MSDAWAFGTLFIFSLGVGTLALRVLDLRTTGVESVALAGAAGLGSTAVGAAVAALIGHLHWFRIVIPFAAAATVVWFGLAHRRPPPALRRVGLPATVLCVMLGAAILGAIAPVTDDDSLAYPIPIARHLAGENTWRFWSDQARSSLPLSQPVLLALAIQSGGERLGLLSAAELALAAMLLVSLGARTAQIASARWLAVIIALGCPAVAFLAASAKEDLLLLTMTLAAAVTLNFPPGRAPTIACGMFAGFAAGAKYSGAPLAIAIVAMVPFCCGREDRIRSVLLAAGAAIAAGGLWYAVNIARFGNPVAPFWPAIGRSPMAETAVAGWVDGFGHGRGPVDAALVPIRMFIDGSFGGRGNWINPLAFAGVAGALIDRRRRVALPLLAIAAALYASWISSVQVSRLLLPSMALLSVPAADVIMRVWRASPRSRYVIIAPVAMSVSVVVAVGIVRFGRYVADPTAFLGAETQHYDSIVWINANLDPAHDRVATWFKTCAYLNVPWMNLDPSYQVEIRPQEIEDPRLLAAALKRQGFTYVFGPPSAFAGIEDSLRMVRTNSASRLGGTRFFRTPLTGAAAIMAIR